MTSLSMPAQAARRRVRPQRARWGLRLLVTTALAVAGVIVIAQEEVGRRIETEITSALLNATTLASGASSGTFEGMPSIVFSVDGSGFLLRLTPSCSVSLFIGPLLVFAALLLLIPRFSILRMLLATGLSAALLAAANQGRLTMLAFVFGHYGTDGFQWAHSLVGSFIMLAALACSAWIFFAVISGQRFRMRTRSRVTAEREVRR